MPSIIETNNQSNDSKKLNEVASNICSDWWMVGPPCAWLANTPGGWRRDNVNHSQQLKAIIDTIPQEDEEDTYNNVGPPLEPGQACPVWQGK